MSRIRGTHEVDRDLPEMLQEVRVMQTGGQLFFAFLFSVAFTPAFEDLSQLQKQLYGWDLFVVATASTVLVAPVAVHQWNFGEGRRPQVLVVTHVLATLGVVLLACGLVLGIALVSSVVFPEASLWLPIGSLLVTILFWVIVPWATKRFGSRWPVADVDQ